MILTPSLKILNVAMLVNGKLKACDRRTIKAKKNHDISSYQCNYQTFSNQQLVEAAEDACEKLKAGTKNFFPARYSGPGFRSDESCFTYPVFGDTIRKFRSRKLLFICSCK